MADMSATIQVLVPITITRHNVEMLTEDEFETAVETWALDAGIAAMEEVHAAVEKSGWKFKS